MELVELSSINKVSLVYVSSCSNTGSIRDDPYRTSRKNSLELIELSSINKVSLVLNVVFYFIVSGIERSYIFRASLV